VWRWRRCPVLAGVVGGGDLLPAGLHAPDLPGVLGDGAVAGEFTTAADVADHHLGPRFRVLVYTHTGINMFSAICYTKQNH